MGLEMLPPPVVDGASDEPVYMPTDHTEADVRVLTEDEVEQVRPVFAEYGHSLPNPATSCFVGAVEEGKVVGFLCLQLRLHAEPMWIADGSSALFSRIAHEAEKVIQQRVGTTDVYLFAPAGKIARLAQAMGMQVEPWVVMSKLIVQEPVQVPEPTQAGHAPFELTPEEVAESKAQMEADGDDFDVTTADIPRVQL